VSRRREAPFLLVQKEIPMKHLETLRASLQEKNQALDTLQKKDSLTEADLTSMETLIGEIEKLGKQIETMEKAQKISAANANPADGSVKQNTVPAAVETKPDTFKSFGEQLSAIAHAGMNEGAGAQRDPRLIWQKSSGANEAVPSEGGFLVQTDFATEIIKHAHDMGEISSRARRIPISENSNGIKLPAVDEDSRVDGSRWGGVRTYWANEGETVDPSKPKFRTIELRLNKLMGVAYATDELLADTVAMEALFRQAFAEEINFSTEDAFVNGDGAGKPLGFINSGALITVTPESGQGSATLVRQNVYNMWNRMPMRSRRNAVWLINDELEPQLYDLRTAGDIGLLYHAPGQNAATPANDAYGRLFTRPVIPIEQSAAAGSVGDMMLVDMSQYLYTDKGGANWNQSMHVRFLFDEMTFKITYRVDGQPAWKKPLTPANGSNTKSPFVALGAR
jgi:HK97 family phage major capsid protein